MDLFANLIVAQSMLWKIWKWPILSSFSSRVQWWPCFWPKTTFGGQKSQKPKNPHFWRVHWGHMNDPKNRPKIWFFGAYPSHRWMRSCSRPKKRILNHFWKKLPLFCFGIKKRPKMGFFRSHFSTPKWGFWINPRPPLNWAGKTVQEKVVFKSLRAHFHGTARAQSYGVR